MKPHEQCSFAGCENLKRVRGLCRGHYKQWRKGKELKPIRGKRSVEDRFWSKVARDELSACWLWTASLTTDGYGQFNIGGTPKRAHRVAWELRYGCIPEGKLLDHRCANRKCVNPAHLRVVTGSQNQQHRTGARRDSRSGVRGVIFDAQRNAWQVQVVLNGRKIHGGRYPTIALADRAARDLRKELFTHDDHRLCQETEEVSPEAEDASGLSRMR